MQQIRLFKSILAMAVAWGTALAPLPALAQSDELSKPAKATISLGILEIGIQVLSQLPENCAKDPKQCSEETLNKALDKSLFANQLLKSYDSSEVRREVVEMMQYLANHASPAQLKKLKAASADYHKTLQDFRIQVAGDQQIALESMFSGAQNRARISSVKANMHTLQTMVETYAVDYGGLYAPDLLTLMREAKKPGMAYWREFTNPYSGKSGAGMSGSVTDYRSYENSQDHKAFAGLVLYQPLKEDGQITTYKIYGCDEKGELIQDKGQTFLLTNF